MPVNYSIREYVYKINDLPQEDRPREKMIKHGPGSLSIKELLAIILISGNRKEDVLEMSDRIIRDYGEKSILAERDVKKLAKDFDVPLIKACQIVACGELGRRFYDRAECGFVTVRSAKDVFNYLADMKNLPKEHLRGLYLNSHNHIIRDEVISIGTVNSSIIHAREVFRPAIECNAGAIILAHNHPSQNVEASDADTEVTKQLVKVGRMIGISILDHVIITKNKFSSVNADY